MEEVALFYPSPQAAKYTLDDSRPFGLAKLARYASDWLAV